MLVKLSDVALDVTEEGAGVPVLFSHGLLMGSWMFRDQIAALRDRFRCVAWDHRGQGRSSPPTTRSVSIETCTTDAVALADHLGLERFHFVGLSMGGFVGMRIAARHPDRVLSLALIATAADREPRRNVPKYRALGLVARALGIHPLLAARVMTIMTGPTFRTSPEHAPVREALREHFLALPTSVVAALNGVIEREGCEAELARITCPTLVLRGAEDRAIAEPRARALAAAIRGARYHEIPGAGHSASIEQPAAVTRALAEFLT